MNDLQIKHLQDNLAEALETITELSGEIINLKSNNRYHRDVKPVERTGDYQRVVDLLADKREELKECKATIKRQGVSVELWKGKFIKLKDRVENLTTELNI